MKKVKRAQDPARAVSETNSRDGLGIPSVTTVDGYGRYQSYRGKWGAWYGSNSQRFD